jgi:hypothetical protein
VLADWSNSKETPWPPEDIAAQPTTALRFALGARVECRVGGRKGWLGGHVVKLWCACRSPCAWVPRPPDERQSDIKPAEPNPLPAMVVSYFCGFRMVVRPPHARGAVKNDPARAPRAAAPCRVPRVSRFDPSELTCGGNDVACILSPLTFYLRYREPGFPPNFFAPYQVALDDGRLIYAPEDVGRFVRAEPVGGARRSAAGGVVAAMLRAPAAL